jgi:DNA-binding CsgD family transcriptional regulator
VAAATRASLNRAPYRGHRAGQYYLPQAQLEVEVYAAEGRKAEALAVIAAADEQFDLARDPRYAWPLLAAGARLCAGGGPAGPDRAAAERATDLPGRLTALASKLDALGPVQQAWRLTFAAATSAELGALSADRPPLDRWDAAVAAWHRLAEPYQVATALLRAAEAALAAGDRDGAAQRLHRAGQLAGHLGARPLGTEIAALARNARLDLGAGRPASRPGPDRFGLTAREFEVLRLVAAGRSNPEIAAELFIAAKTASVHVSNILAKLGVSSRGEAAATAHRLRLFDPERA